jgi:hypothetical protein
MDEGLSLRHSKWACKYHIVFIPKCRRRVLYGQLRNDLGEVFLAVARHKVKPDRRRASDGGPCSYVSTVNDIEGFVYADGHVA